MSVLAYLIPVWGGYEGYLVKALQVLQNRAARQVTKLSWFTPSRRLLSQCNWLSIKQLIFYHSVLQVWKVRTAEVPVYLNSRMQLSVTRSAEEGTLRVQQVEMSLSGKSFLVRAAVMWNSIPASIRSIKKLETFKSRLKTWTKQNVEIE